MREYHFHLKVPKQDDGSDRYDELFGIKAETALTAWAHAIERLPDCNGMSLTMTVGDPIVDSPCD